MATIYHFELCRAILVCFRRRLKATGICQDGYAGLLEAGQEKVEVHRHRIDSASQVSEVEIDGAPSYRDDLT